MRTDLRRSNPSSRRRRSLVHSCLRSWRVSDFIGQVLPRDVGKRVYERKGILQVESDEQKERRISRGLKTTWGNPSPKDVKSSRLYGVSSPYGSTRVRKLQSEIADLKRALRHLTTKRERLEDEIAELKPHEGDIERDLQDDIEKVEGQMDDVLRAIRSARDDLEDLQRELEE